LLELDGEAEFENDAPEPMGRLVLELALIGQSIGSYETLKASDTKYEGLIGALKDYCPSTRIRKSSFLLFIKTRCTT
jgi:hypothetical protein